MAGTSANIRELRSRLSYYLRLTKAGQSVVITERGRPIGRIIPEKASLGERLDAMAKSGLLEWNKKKLKPIKPAGHAKKGGRSVADVLIEDRR